MTARIERFTPSMAPLGPAALAIGVFDGVHRGHQTLIADTVAAADERGIRSVVLTFDRDPDLVVSPESAAPQLLHIDDKLELLAATGTDTVVVVGFDAAIAALTPERFCDEIVVSACTPRLVVVGYDFRFGARARGNVMTLQSLGEQRGFEVLAHDLLEAGGIPITSTRVRAFVAAGDVAGAATLLGRAHRVRGDVVRGRGAGHALGVPTANLAVAPEAALPASGVYAGSALVGDERYPAAISSGLAPSFPDAQERLEAHLIGYEGRELYGEQIVVEFAERLRAQRRFESPDELTAAMRADISRAAAVFAGS